MRTDPQSPIACAARKQHTLRRESAAPPGGAFVYRTLQILISSYALVPMPIFSACSRQLIQSVSGWMRWKWSWSWVSPPSAAEPRITG